MKDLIVHQVNISHYRLVELAKLADQAKPFFDWVEKKAKKTTGSHKGLSEILLTSSKKQIKDIIAECYQADEGSCPLLFDGIGRVYKHPKACFFFFAWLVRDAPQQRLAPLISRMQKADDISKLVAETDTLVALITEYRGVVRSFDWSVVREVFIDRLEGSRRSISGHRLEANVRTSLITAIQHFYSIHNNYGKFSRVDIAEKQIKIGQHSIDISAEFIPKNGGEPLKILIPVKTRETEGVVTPTSLHVTLLPPLLISRRVCKMFAY
jgi:hypothetical protein